LTSGPILSSVSAGNFFLDDGGVTRKNLTMSSSPGPRLCIRRYRWMKARNCPCRCVKVAMSAPQAGRRFGSSLPPCFDSVAAGRGREGHGPPAPLPEPARPESTVGGSHQLVSWTRSLPLEEARNRLRRCEPGTRREPDHPGEEPMARGRKQP